MKSFMFQDCWGPRTQPRDQTCWLAKACNHFSLSLCVLCINQYKPRAMSSGSGKGTAPAVAAAPRRHQRGQTRKAPEGSGQPAPAAKAQKAVNGDIAQQAKASFADVVVGRVPERQIIPVLVAMIQLEQLVQNNQAVNNGRRDDFLRFRTATSAQLEQTLRCSKRRNLVVLGVAESSVYNTPNALATHLQDLLFEGSPSSASSQLRLPLGQVEVLEKAQSCACGAYCMQCRQSSELSGVQTPKGCPHTA